MIKTIILSIIFLKKIINIINEIDETNEVNEVGKRDILNMSKILY